MPRNKVHAFWQMMRRTKSVMTGSTALLFWRGLNTFEPGDLDISTSYETADQVVDWFIRTLCWDRVSEDDHIYNEIPPEVSGIDRIIRLSNGLTSVDIIVSRGMSPLLPIADFWSTILRVFVAADGACCAYPDQMRASVGLLSQTQQRRSEESTLVMKEKYRKRGIRNVDSVEVWASLYDGGCDDQWVCPVEWRRFGDKGSVVCWFLDGLSLEHNPDLMMYDIPVLWRLGGEASHLLV
jgi:hypothetical protein